MLKGNIKPDVARTVLENFMSRPNLYVGNILESQAAAPGTKD
jgi:hypothetical protein